MKNNALNNLLNNVKSGKISVEDAALKIKMQPFVDMGFAKADTQRLYRQGETEVIFGQGKTADQIAEIAAVLKENNNSPVLITRLCKKKAERVKKIIDINYDSTGNIALFGDFPKVTGSGKILIATGGTSDLPVAKEAEFTARALGNDTELLADIGVSGLHRIISNLDEIMSATVIIAIAGMEGALASVIGGLADAPVIAVPTSVGYGASFNGLTALLSMLNSCASGVSVVNIDNGFGAAYQASMINHIGVKN